MLPKEKELWLYGAGGHALVVRDIFEVCGRKVFGIVDDNAALTEWHGLQVVHKMPFGVRVIIAIGDNYCRKQVAEKIGAEFVSAIHPNAIVSDRTSVDIGTCIMAGAVINPYATIGKHCIVNTSSTIDHECIVSDYVHISPNASLCGGVTVGVGAWIGAGATIIPGIRIGNWAVVGAGSVVLHNVPDNTVVAGCPAHVIKISSPRN